MKTIEERAWEKYPEVIKHHNLAHIDINEEKRKMYIDIATEQKAIDDEILSIIDSLQQEESGAWIKIDADHPLPYGQEVIGYNKEWVHEDFNPSGTRVGFLNDIGFISAKWVDDQDCYTTCSEEGDDYTISQILPDGTRKTWRKYENGEAVEGYLPNMPTHFMLIPKTPDGFSWPYNAEKK